METTASAAARGWRHLYTHAAAGRLGHRRQALEARRAGGGQGLVLEQRLPAAARRPLPAPPVEGGEGGGVVAAAFDQPPTRHHHRLGPDVSRPAVGAGAGGGQAGQDDVLRPGRQGRDQVAAPALVARRAPAAGQGLEGGHVLR
ncbi:MAG: hypothetical protein D6696_16295, partial [Acidobacteria bacterium]